MDDSGKKRDRGDNSVPDETWVQRLGGAGVITYVGLLRQNPSDDDLYDLYLNLDMRSCLQIRKEDVVHWENLPPEKSPLGSLGGARLYVRLGATIRSVRTATNSFEAGAGDEFDLDIRLGAARRARAASDDLTIPDTGCGPACATIPPFTFPEGCGEVATLQCPTFDPLGCIPTQKGFSVCICGPFTQGICGVTRGFTCATNCGTCQTNCGTCQTCQTCRTNCGTCNTCNTRCGQETCGPCNTHLFTECNQNTCNIC
ncbi:MAG: hypothetical protein ACREMA_02970 [Longimicrobiales bacterium]